MEVFSQELLRTKIIETSKKIFNKGLIQAGEGNISFRYPEKDEMMITPVYKKFEIIKKKDIIHMKLDGTVISKDTEPSPEYRLHTAIYKARPKAQCTIHTHSPYATMMAITKKPIPIILEEQVIFLGGAINISEFAQAHSENFGEKVIKAMGNKNGVLLANHGALVCGRTIDDAIKMAELVEKLAFIYVGAQNLGEINDIPEKECSKFMEDFEKLYATHA